MDDGYQWNDNLTLLSTLTKTCQIENDCQKTRLPIQKGLLEMVLFEISRAYSKKQPFLEALYTSALLVAYYGMLRVGEIAQGPHVIKAKDVHESKTSNKLLFILYSSKTHNKGNRPQMIKIDGKTKFRVDGLFTAEADISPSLAKSYYCPVEQTVNYISLRGPRKNDEEQFFIFRDGSPLKPHHIRTVLRTALNNLTLDGGLYDIHSFRIGRATDLEKLGVSIDQIKSLGRWRSNAVYAYLRNAQV